MDTKHMPGANADVAEAAAGPVSMVTSVDLSTRVTDPSRFDLLMSVLITDKRRSNKTVPGRNRYPRFDSFMYTLESCTPCAARTHR